MSEYIRPETHDDQPNAGFVRKEVSRDGYIAQLREEHGLPEAASLEEIEPIAKVLLDNPSTALSAAELILNRRVDAREKMIGQVLFSGIIGTSIGQRFGMLLLERATEDLMRERGITDFGTEQGFDK